jgi:hypothetical protein
MAADRPREVDAQTFFFFCVQVPDASFFRNRVQREIEFRERYAQDQVHLFLSLSLSLHISGHNLSVGDLVSDSSERNWQSGRSFAGQF